MESQFLDTTESSDDESCEEISVSNLNNIIKDKVKKNFYNIFSVIGEVSNKKICNGNIYFSLKDEKSNINSILWKSINNQLIKNNISFQNGDKVTVKGKLDFYQKNGSLSLIIFDLKNNNMMGDLYLKYQKLKKKYSEKGYFDEKNKLTIPSVIFNIGLVTSKEGAAIQDILFVLKNNFIFSKVFVYNCRVQGDKCHSEVCDGINYFQNKKIDLIIVSRGGGSYEDLFEFSHKSIIKTIYKSKIFTISAVGHQIDYMLSDFVSDYRAPTPSIAGEFVSNIQRNFLDNLYEKKEECNRIVNDYINDIKYKIANYISQLPNFNKLFLNILNQKMINNNNIIKMSLNNYKMNLKILEDKLNFLNPKKKLENNLKFNKNIMILNSKKKIVNSYKEIDNNIYYLKFFDGNIKVKISLI